MPSSMLFNPLFVPSWEPTCSICTSSNGLVIVPGLCYSGCCYICAYAASLHSYNVAKWVLRHGMR
jgi:hypothetical protein